MILWLERIAEIYLLEFVKENINGRMKEHSNEIDGLIRGMLFQKAVVL